MPIYPIDLVNGDPEGLNRHGGTRRRSSPGSPSCVGNGFYAVPSGGECRRTERSNLFATASIQLNGYPVGITDRDETAFMPIYPIDLVNGDLEGLNRHGGTRRRSSPGSPSCVGNG